MILIADSGSTKTEWMLVSGKEPLHKIRSGGLNPFFLDEVQIAEIVSREVCASFPENTVVKEIFFYGAGCGTPEKCKIIHDGLRIHFEEAKIEVHSDLFGAARALCKRSKGLLGILGTGSNSGFYNGDIIINKVPSLGYILGDEGSGAYIGKKILRDYLYGEMPAVLNADFEKVYAVSKGDILEHIYRRPLANRYIASFAAFAGKHKDEKYIQDLLKNSFRKYFKRTIMKYPEHLMYPVHFTGSIAWNFSDVLKTSGEELGLKIGTISENPLDGLVEFHRGKAK